MVDHPRHSHHIIMATPTILRTRTLIPMDLFMTRAGLLPTTPTMSQPLQILQLPIQPTGKQCNFVVVTQCGNSENLLSPFFRKNYYVKSTYLVLNYDISCFHGIFPSEGNFSFFHTVYYLNENDISFLIVTMRPGFLRLIKMNLPTPPLNEQLTR